MHLCLSPGVNYRLAMYPAKAHATQTPIVRQTCIWDDYLKKKKKPLRANFLLQNPWIYKSQDHKLIP